MMSNTHTHVLVTQTRDWNCWSLDTDRYFGGSSGSNVPVGTPSYRTPVCHLLYSTGGPLLLAPPVLNSRTRGSWCSLAIYRRRRYHIDHINVRTSFILLLLLQLLCIHLVGRRYIQHIYDIYLHELSVLHTRKSADRQRSG